ncbi:MAG TPA: LysM peptidoglycan-binding domain-containing protein, partial [Spirochaetales bacterium]|nr:LysM peptidoglycan-binding domain-containing protein [Spirochaetales bacterium]
PGVQQGQQTGQQTGQTSAPAQVQPAQTTQQTKPSTSTKPPKPAPGSKTPGVWYKIRWGDTLWDLSIAFYRTPWKYMKIYNANRKLIKHPDKIISGTWIYVPK